MAIPNSILDQFEVDLQNDNGSFVASIPKLGIQATGATAQAALDELGDKQRILLSALTPQLEPGVVAPATTKQRPPTAGGDLRSFAIKTCVVLVATVVGVYFVTQQLQGLAEATAYSLQTSLRQATGGGAEFWSPIEINLARLADPSNDLPPEKKARQLREIRTVVDRWRPFVSEILAILIPEDKLGKASGLQERSLTPSGG